ncbi:hypothetical protein [Sorangium sp. So ce426]|uniref:hypothetical protein n=1 Tax=unclassified Sorangium TaxID=2621164 RepID=UPI003F5BF2BA
MKPVGDTTRAIQSEGEDEAKAYAVGEVAPAPLHPTVEMERVQIEDPRRVPPPREGARRGGGTGQEARGAGGAAEGEEKAGAPGAAMASAPAASASEGPISAPGGSAASVPTTPPVEGSSGAATSSQQDRSGRPAARAALASAAPRQHAPAAKNPGQDGLAADTQELP